MNIGADTSLKKALPITQFQDLIMVLLHMPESCVVICGTGGDGRSRQEVAQRYVYIKGFIFLNR
jgi:hypothetical protein